MTRPLEGQKGFGNQNQQGKGRCSEGSHSELLAPNTPFYFENTEKAVVDLGCMDWEAWLRDDDRAMLSLMQEFQCLHYLYLREPAHRAKSLDDVLTTSCERSSLGKTLSFTSGLMSLGFAKSLLHATVPCRWSGCQQSRQWNTLSQKISCR